MKRPIPILVGVAQRTYRPQTVDDFVSPIEMMAEVVRRAAEDARCPGLIECTDALHVGGILAWSAPDPPGALAEALGCRPAVREYRMVGGDSPQWYVNRAADNLTTGRSEIAVLVGCEVMRSATLVERTGKKIAEVRGWKVMVDAELTIPLVGDRRMGIHPLESAHGADRAVRLYPLIENAMRARLGLSIEGQRAQLGRFGEEFSRVASTHPYAWFPIARSKEEIVTPTAQNRMVAFPYTKYLCAMNQVDQAAAVIMTTARVARRLGIPQSQWIYPWAGQDAHDVWYLSQRAELADSPAIKACADDVLRQAGVTLDEVDFFDLYSCFPCMPRLTQMVLGIAADDPRPATVTGGLPYFGGPGNNYSMHAIATAVERLRAQRSEVGMITANGWYCTKHSMGLYSGQEPKHAWSRIPPQRFQEGLALPPELEIEPQPRGTFAVDSYTVCHDRSGEVEFSILCGRTADGRRAWAQTPRADTDILRAMTREEWIGREAKISTRQGDVNLVEF